VAASASIPGGGTLYTLLDLLGWDWIVAILLLEARGANATVEEVSIRNDAMRCNFILRYSEWARRTSVEICTVVCV